MRYLILIVMLFVGIGNLGAKEPKEIWYCPMHPSYTSPRFGQCPICNMDLVKQQVKADGNQQVDNHAAVELSNKEAMLMGVKTTPALVKDIVKTVHAPGYAVSASELFAKQNDFIDAYINYVKAFRDFKRVDTRRRSWETHRALQTKVLEAKDALLKLGLSQHQVEKLQQVSWNKIWEQPELLMFDDNQHFWVLAQIFEQDLGFVEVGQDVDVEIPAYHEHLKGKIRSVGGFINQESRSVNALIEINNYKGELAANLLAQVTIPVSLGKVLMVPPQAVMDLGDSNIVFVKEKQGVYRPQLISIAFEGDDAVAINKGINVNDEVVVEGNFLLDSESRMRAAMNVSQEGHVHDK